MDTSRVAFLKALKSFPRWMEIRKRPQKAVGAKLLQSIMDEQDNIINELDAFKKDFFLVSYVGREEEILDHVFIYQVGDIDIANLKMVSPKVQVTNEPRRFIEKHNDYILYQEGYIMLSPAVKGNLKKVELLVDGYSYGGKLKRLPLWNIFDEFAMFLSLERFEEETNKELLHRCFAAFRNPTNSTEQGIKNAIVNTVMNIVPLSDEDIEIQTPGVTNVYEQDSAGEEIYEKLARFNQDIFRTKRWNMDTWEHEFKKLDYFPHVWDAPVEVYQDGVGQLDDLKVSLSNDISDLEKTDVSITGYKTDVIAVNNYILSQNIQKEIPLKLERYQDVLKPKTVSYKIVASPVVKVDQPQNVYVKSMTKTSGEVEQLLEDIVIDPGSATILNGGALTAGKKYRLGFFAKASYADMVIDRAALITGNVETSLLKETPSFKKKDGSLRNIDVRAHISNVNDLKTATNIISHRNGFRLAAGQTVGDLYVDATGMSNEYMFVGHECEAEDITSNRGLVKLKGFTETADGKLQDKSTSVSSTITMEVEGYSLSFDYINSSTQGSCTVLITVDGNIDSANSGLWTASRSFSAEYDHCASIKVQITKAGMHPVEFANVKAKRYKVEVELLNDSMQELIDASYGKILPPLAATEQNVIHVRLTNLGAKTPVINYVHIGSSMENAAFFTDEFTATAGSHLSIRSDCRVELYEVVSGANVTVDSNFRAYKRYRNNTADDIYVGIDTSNFISITSSSKKIENATKNGNVIKCIRLKPGEELDSIILSGDAYKLLNKEKLTTLVGMAPGEELYVSNKSRGFIVRNTAAKTERLAVIPRNKFPSNSKNIAVENLPTNMSAAFVIDEKEDKSAVGSSFDRNFEFMYVTHNNDEQYVGYNKTTMFSSPLNNVPMSNTFSPVLDTTRLMYYEVEDAVKGADASTKARFMKPAGTPEKWTLGIKNEGLQITTDMGYNNSSSYAMDIERYNESFTISNRIVLPETIKADGENVELGRYIITPPDDMKIIYVEESVVQREVIIENDGFNKLWHSNVVTINDVQLGGASIARSRYSLLVEDKSAGGKEGIILWNDKNLYGQKVDIVYTYKKPLALTYKSLMSLYDLIGYNVDAYKKINATPFHYVDLIDNEVRMVDFKEVPDKIVIQCSNPNFQATVEGNLVRVKRVTKDNNVILNTGFYYDNGVEYYLFNHMHEEKIDRMNGVYLFNVKRNGNTLELFRRSTNYVKDSAFSPGRKEVLCDIDCQTNKRIQGLSELESVTACDSYNMWQSFNMKVQMKQGVHDLGIHFEPTDRHGYAVMDITRFAKKGKMISFAATKSLETYMAKEVLADSQSMQKSIFVEKETEFKDEGTYRSYVFDEEPEKDTRYYIMVQGVGVIDDIIARPYDLNIDTRTVHKKNIEAIGFAVDEPLEKNMEVECDFDIIGNHLNRLDITKDGTVITGSNVDWGLTKIYEFSRDIDSYWLRGAVIKHGAIYAEERTATIKSPTIFLENHKAIKSIYVKINDVLINGMKNFDIRLKGANSLGEVFQTLVEEPKTNLARIFEPKLMPYLQIEVDMPAERVINNIEVYAEYAESDSPLHIIPNSDGELISKVYDTTYAANYQLTRIEGALSNIDDIDIYIRGCRRDTTHEVWTKWYKEKLDKNQETELPHIFENYQLFQFKLVLKKSKAQCSIDKYVLEVV